MDPSWKEALKREFHQDYFTELASYVETERRNYTIYPPDGETFTAFKLTPFDKVKVVILGQDPYHQPGQAHGLAFSVKQGVPIPPSLQNIYKELRADLGVKTPAHGFLGAWAERGVFLMNATMTVRAGAPASHKGQGWEVFTDAVIRTLVSREKPIVFILWGHTARMKKSLIPVDQHTIIESAHPSPNSCHSGFFGSKPFSKANAALDGYGHVRVDWEIPG
jgi:uracil-DNA glycosylase